MRRWLRARREQRQADYSARATALANYNPGVHCEYEGCGGWFESYNVMWRHQEREHSGRWVAP